MSLLNHLYIFQWYKELFWRAKDKLHTRPSSIEEFARRAYWRNVNSAKLNVSISHDAPDYHYAGGRQHTFYSHHCQITVDASKSGRNLILQLEEHNFTGQPISDDTQFDEFIYKTMDELKMRFSNLKLSPQSSKEIKYFLRGRRTIDINPI